MKAEELMTVTTPMFTPEMGYRFMIARKKSMKTQKDLARFLGVSQAFIAAVELGKVRSARFSVHQMRVALCPSDQPYMLGYILLGTNKERVKEAAVLHAFYVEHNRRKIRSEVKKREWRSLEERLVKNVTLTKGPKE